MKIMYNDNKTNEEVFFKTKGMCTFIKMEYLVASALVELMDKKEINKISLKEIEEYGYKVEQILVQQNVNAILLYSNNYTKEFLEDYSDYFELEGDCIKVKSGVSPNEIRNHILAYISAKVLLALLSTDSLSAIVGLKN